MSADRTIPPVDGPRVLVAGASIAGPALAHWLRRRGAEVTVVERAPGLRPGGQAVDARGVAKDVIKRMGLDAEVRAARTVTAGAQTVDADGLHSHLRETVFGPRERFVRHLGHVLAFYSVPNEFGLDRWLIEYSEGGRSSGLRPIHEATEAMAMFSFPAADLTADHRDLAAQKRLLRERMAGHGWLTPRILDHVDDAGDFYLDQVAQVVMDRWSSGRVGLFGDAAFSSSPMSGQGTGLALIGAYLLAGELAAAGWDPEVGFANFDARMRPTVEANQEIARLNARMRLPGPDPEPAPDFASEWFSELIQRAIHGPELPDYAGVPDSGPSGR